MTEELSLITAVPAVILTKAKPFSTTVEVRAGDLAARLSIHYDADMDNGVPTVQDKLLVAVLSGVYPEWLRPQTNQPVEGEVPITYRAVSAAPRGGSDPSRARQFDNLKIETVEHGVLKRLVFTTLTESGQVVHARVELSKGQVTSMLAVLLALYPRLCEE